MFNVQSKKVQSKKVGIFGGSFNPIHTGHIALAKSLCEKAGLDEVWFMVSPQNPFKQAIFHIIISHFSLLISHFIISACQVLDGFWHHSVDTFPLKNRLAYLGAADVEQRRLHDGYSLRNGSDACSLTGIDHDRVVDENVIVMKPLVESCPVVSTY